MRLRLQLFSILVSLLTLPAIADDAVKFRRLMVSNGLSDNSVQCALRDKYGFVWFGTSNGLNCTDGYTNIIYRNIAASVMGGTGSDIVKSVAELGDNLLIGGINGVTLYRRATNTFEKFGVATRYGVTVSSIVQAMFKARNGMVWIGTFGQGVFVYDPATGSLVQNSRHGGFVSSICQTADGTVCLAMINGDINFFRPDGRFLSSCSIPDYQNDKNSICIFAQGNSLWVGCDAGLYHLDKAARRFDFFRPALKAGAVNAISKASPTELYVGTRRGVYLFNTVSHDCVRIDGKDRATGLTDTFVNGLMTDADGTLWVLTNMGGVCYLPRNGAQFSYNAVGGADADSHNVVHAFLPSPDGDMWVGTSAGLCHYNPATGATVPFAGGLGGLSVSTLMLDGNSLWVGTWTDGIRVVDLATGAMRSFVYSEKVPYTVMSNGIRRLFRSSKGIIYVATNWGICWFDSRTERFMTFSSMSSLIAFEDICEDCDGNIWAASSANGLYKYVTREHRWQHYAHGGGKGGSLPSNSLSAVTCDSRGRVWVATKGDGAAVYDKASDSFRRVDGVTGNVSFIAEDSRRNVWLANESELVMMRGGNPSDMVLADSPDMLWQGGFMRRAATRLGRNMVVSGFDGFYSFNPQTVGRAVKAPVYIQSISLPYLSDSEAEVEKLGINRPLYINNNVELPYRDNSFTLHFTSPQFVMSRNPRYEYMLKGVDKQWVSQTGAAEATYSNVPPGNYEFLLRSASNDGKVQRLFITVLPPWYRTAIAYLVYLLLIAAACYLVWLRARIKVRAHYNRKLEMFRVEQEKKTFESKITFFVNLVHEIRTPLSLITLPLERLRHRPHDDVDSRLLSVVSKNVGYLLSITNQLLDFQKVENGKFEIHRANMSLRELMQNSYDQFAAFCDAEGKRLELHLPDGDIVVGADKAALTKVMMNLMSNAMKYTRTRIVMRLARLDGGMVGIDVEDDGPGVRDADKKRIFEAFYQVGNDNVARMLGTGLGLAFARSLAVAHGGDLTVADAPGGGSCFRLTVPDAMVDAAAEKDEPLVPQMVSTGAGAGANPDTRSFVVLLVEDNADLLEMTAEVLADWYKVVRARNGAEAVDVLAHTDVDIVVSDVMMPVMDGIELCSKIKADVATSHVPVVLLTAKTNIEAKVEGMRSGADAYLEKPFAIDQLHMQIENLFRLRQMFHKRMVSAEGTVDAASASDFGINQQNMAFLEKVQEILEEGIPNEDFSIDSLAEQMFMSRSSFYRKLKSLTGMTPVEFLKVNRMKRAAQLLIKGVSVSDVAQKVGFSSPSYFTKCFKQTYDVLPKDYVAQKLSEIDSGSESK